MLQGVAAIGGGGGGGGAGDVVGPGSSTDNAVVRFDGTTGKIIQNSVVTIDDSGNTTIPIAKSLLLSTDQPTNTATGLIQLHYTTNEAKAIIAYVDENGQEVIWLQAHNYLLFPSNQHKHFSIEASDAAGLKQTRLGVGYGADVVEVTVNQADLIINRNTAMTNGNIVMQGGGGGGVIKHANALDIYPSYVSNSTFALRTSLSASQIHLSVLGDSVLYVDEGIATTGAITPQTNDGAALGTTALEWADLFLASGSVINFNNGDVTLTHSTDTLTVAGGTLATADIALSTGSAIKTKTTAGNTVLFQARDVDGAAYTTFATLTANNIPSFTISPQRIVAAKTQAVSPYSVSNVENWTVFTNEGATAQVVFNLPTAVAGYTYEFIVQDADGIQVVASSGDTIRLGTSVSASAGNATSTTIGSAVILTCINATEWIAESIVGTWIVT